MKGLSLVALVAAVAAVAAMACGAPAPSAGDAGSAADADASQADAAIAPSGDATADEPVPVCHVRGTVTDTNDQPWLDARVQVCSASLCTVGKAANGSFDVGVPCGGDYHVLAQKGAADARQASAGIGVLPGDGEVTTDVALAEPVRIPQTPPPVALASGVHAVAVTAELTLVIDPGDLAFYGDGAVAAVRVDESRWPAYAIAGKTILAMWALAPWGVRAHAGKSVGVEVKNGLGLQPGDTVSVYAVSEATAALGAPSQATVSADGTTLGGATVDRLTWIVLAH